MPIYEYQCQQCGHRSEALQKVADPPLTTCERCGGELKRLISSPAVQFKGSGWYVTDYARRGGGGAGGKAGGEAPAKSDGGGGESKADKPAAGGGDAGSGSAPKTD